jgi:hypothetical protein
MPLADKTPPLINTDGADIAVVVNIGLIGSDSN